jgi:hypothetical protein
MREGIILSALLVSIFLSVSMLLSPVFREMMPAAEPIYV